MIYWQPDIDPGTIILTDMVPIPDVPATQLPRVDRHAIRRDPDGTSMILDADAAALRLLLLDEARSDSPLAAIVPLDATALDRIEALTRLWRTINRRAPRADTRLTEQRRQRLRQMLQASDGHLDGATYREIANALYGAARVAADPWKTSPLRDSAIALVKDGRALIAGGYRKLLRRRRRG